METSHPRHRRSQEGGIGRDLEVPIRPPRVRRRLPGSRQVGGRNRSRLGQPCDTTLGFAGLEERTTPASGAHHAAG